MNKLSTLAGTVLLLLLGAAPVSFAAQPRTYQVTGPVLEVRDDVVVVAKGKEKWEIARTAETRITGDLKVGAKVTIEYRMSAATVEVKGAPAADKAAGKADKAPAPEKAAAAK